jgi:transcriptional regulator
LYAPAAFALEPEAAWSLLKRSRLGVLVTGGAEGFSASHLPFLLDREGGRLLGHLAAPNPQAAETDGRALVIFPGPDAYVSPSFYPSKAEHGRVVPTWNYEALHVHGTVRFFRDAERLHDLVDRLSARFEAGRPSPWSVADAPADYVERLLRGIVGVEVTVDRVEGVRKLSQNKAEADRTGVREGLAAGDTAERRIAALMSA